MSATHSDIRRYKVNYIKEQEGIALYRALARAEQNTQRAEIFEKLATAEEHHAARWATLLQDNDVALPLYRPSFRVRLLGWVSRTLGTQHVLPIVSGLEFRDQGEYLGQAEATGMPAAERSHSRTLQLMMQENAAAGVQSIDAHVPTSSLIKESPSAPPALIRSTSAVERSTPCGTS